MTQRLGVATGPGPVISYVDEAFFLGSRTGQESIIQTVWVYDRPPDLEAIRAFHRGLGRQRISRLVERSPLPFGRSRWAAAPLAPLDVTVAPRPPEDLPSWIDEQVRLPLDPEHGPPWRLGVAPFTDGRTAVSLVVSHCAGDGGSIVDAIGRAATGRDATDDDSTPGYPPPRSRRRLQAIGDDLRQVLADLWPIVRAAVKVVQVLGASLRARRRAPGTVGSRTKVTQPAPGDDALVLVPSVTAFIDPVHWDERAAAFDGAGRSLLAALAAQLGERFGRVRDGRVLLLVPVEDRAADRDQAANAVDLARVVIDVADIGDLPAIRDAIREGIAAARERPDPTQALWPLVPFVPVRGATSLMGEAVDFVGEPAVTLSYMGDLSEDVLRIDGTPASRFQVRGGTRTPTRATLARRGGGLTVLPYTVGGTLVVNVIGYQPDRVTTRSQLRALVADALDALSVAAVIE
ncbi:MAG: hypothetical protein ACKOA9_02820 [Actinomycetota bacterium]